MQGRSCHLITETSDSLFVFFSIEVKIEYLPSSKRKNVNSKLNVQVPNLGSNSLAESFSSGLSSDLPLSLPGFFCETWIWIWNVFSLTRKVKKSSQDKKGKTHPCNCCIHHQQLVLFCVTPAIPHAPSFHAASLRPVFVAAPSPCSASRTSAPCMCGTLLAPPCRPWFPVVISSKTHLLLTPPPRAPSCCSSPWPAGPPSSLPCPPRRLLLSGQFWLRAETSNWTQFFATPPPLTPACSGPTWPTCPQLVPPYPVSTLESI